MKSSNLGVPAFICAWIIAFPAVCYVQDVKASGKAIESPQSLAPGRPALDVGFLKLPPNRKTKSRVDLSSIDNERDLAAIREAIDPIIRFFLVITQVRQPESVIESVTTEHGMKQLRYPPKQNEVNRYVSRKIWNWRVIDEKTIALSVEFRGLLKRDPPHVDDFVFVKTPAGWKFDRHEQ